MSVMALELCPSMWEGHYCGLDAGHSDTHICRAPACVGVSWTDEQSAAWEAEMGL